jgi:hypothetical protein
MFSHLIFDIARNRIARPTVCYPQENSSMILRTPLLLLALCAPSLFLTAQTTPAPGTAASASSTLQPSLDVLRTALGATNVDRWKTSAAVRGEEENNLKSIRNDVSTTLPALLAAADAAPGSPAKLLPAYRNVDALYDVVLRVDAAGRIAAPADQSSAFDQALASLESARRTLGDQLQHFTESQEMQVGHLQAALKAIPPPAPLPPPPAPIKCPVTPVRKKKPAAKPAAKPTASSASSQSSTPTH